MTMHVTLDLPVDLEEKLRRETANLDAEVTEVYAVELFRRGRLSHYELARVLGLDRYETDSFLKRHGVFDGSPTMADLEADRRTLDRILGKAD
jgi:predicted HTH domain antitoxin